QRDRPDRALARQRLDRLGRDVVHHALVAAAQETSHHVGAHPTETDHADLHPILLSTTFPVRPDVNDRPARPCVPQPNPQLHLGSRPSFTPVRVPLLPRSATSVPHGGPPARRPSTLEMARSRALGAAANDPPGPA